MVGKHQRTAAAAKAAAIPAEEVASKSSARVAWYSHPGGPRPRPKQVAAGQEADDDGHHVVER